MHAGPTPASGLAPDPAAGSDDPYAAQLAKPYLDADEEQAVRRLLGRPPKARSAVAARCPNGLAAVLRVDPRDAEGKPFPTMFWLCAPLAAREIGRLEASGVMRELSDRLRADDVLAAAYRGAAERFVALRDRLGPPIPGDPTQGGMPTRVKCLHSLYAHWLATGDNPIGAWVAEQVPDMPCHAQCRPDAAADAASGSS